MKKFKLLCLILIVCLGALSLFACKNPIRGIDKIQDKIDDIENFKDYEDFKNSVKNYSMTINVEEETIVIKVCEGGYLYESDTMIYFLNVQENKAYYIEKKSNAGYAYAVEDIENWEDQTGIVALLFSYQFAILNMKKGGTAKIAGRNCTIYNYERNNITAKYYIDNEYSFLLKSETSQNGVTKITEVTSFSIGTVTLSNMIDLSKYTITNLDDLALNCLLSEDETKKTIRQLDGFFMSWKRFWKNS